MKTVLVSVLVSAGLTAAFAAERWSLKVAGTNATGLNHNTWVASDGTTESTEIKAGDDYVIGTTTDNKTIYVSSAKDEYNVFAGNSLQIGEVGGKILAQLQQYGNFADGTADCFGPGGIILARGDWRTQYQVSDVYQIGGKVTVTASASSPFRILRGGNRETEAHGMAFNGPLCGSGYLSVTANAYTTADYGMHFTLHLLGGCEDFSGVLTTTEGYDVNGKHKRVGLVVATTTSPGSFTVGTGCDIAPHEAGDVFTCETLKIQSGSTVKVLAKDIGTGAERTVKCSKYVAKSNFELGENVKLEVVFDDAARATYTDVLELITAPKGSGLTETAFLYTPDDKHPKATLSVRDDDNGETQTLILTSPAELPTLTQKATGTNVDGINGVTWSDDSTGTSPNYNYSVESGFNIYVSSAATADNWSSLNGFNGNSLRIGNVDDHKKGNFYHYGWLQAMDFPNDGVILSYGNWYVRYPHDYFANGKVRVVSTTSYPFSVSSVAGDATLSTSTLTWTGPLSGAGVLKVQAGNVKTATCTNFCLKVYGGAEEFTGTISVESLVAETSHIDCRAGLALTNGVMPAAVSVMEKSYLVAPPAAGETATVRSLALEDATELRIVACVAGASAEAATRSTGLVKVTDSFTKTGKTKVVISMEQLQKDGLGGIFPLLTVPATSALSKDDFTFDLCGDKRRIKVAELVVLEDADAQTKTLALSTVHEATGLMLLFK